MAQEALHGGNQRAVRSRITRRAEPRARLAALAFAALALALVPPPEPARAAGNVLVVTTTADDVATPPSGSLREAVETLAQPGDVIRFDGPIEVELVANLVIRPDLAGLRIEGPGGIRAIPAKGKVKRRTGDAVGRIVVLADDVTLDGVNLSNHFVDAAGTYLRLAQVPVSRVKVKNCTFAGNGGVNFDNVDSGEISDCTFDVHDVRAFSAVIDLDTTTGCKVLRNTIAALPNARQYAISDVEGTDDQFISNVAHSDVVLQLRSGWIEKTVMPEAQLFLLSPPGGATGHVSVYTNQVAKLTVARVDTYVEGNTIKAVAGSGGFRDPRRVKVPGFGSTLFRIAPGGPGSAAAPVIAVLNSVEGGEFGIGYVDTAGRGSGSLIESNLVLGASRTGIYVASRGEVLLQSNLVESVGDPVRKKGTGIEIRSGSGEVTLTGNFAQHVQGFGFSIDGKGPEVHVIGGAASSCQRAGYLVERRAAFLERVKAEDGANDGIACARGSLVRIEQATVRGNSFSGVYVDSGGFAEIRRISSSANLAAGIDISPRGVSPNPQRLRANRDVPFPEQLEFLRSSQRVDGKAPPGSTVDAYEVEAGARQGNDRNGEGFKHLGSVDADPSGAFSWPVGTCPASGLLTFTATIRHNGIGMTSEFSENVACEPGFTLDLVSKSAAGVAGDADSDLLARTGAFPASGVPCVGAGGRFVAYASKAGNLTADAHDPDDVHVYLSDLQSGTTQRLSTTFDGGDYEPDFHEFAQVAGTTASVSDDGRFVAFVAWSGRIVPGEGYPIGDGPTVVLFDSQSGTKTAVTDPTYFDSPLPSGEFSHGGGSDCAISGDGSAVAFVSFGRDWDLTEPDSDEDVFLWTRATGSIERVSTTTAGGDQPWVFQAYPLTPRLSGDARFVVFASAQPLDPTNDTAGTKVFLRDRQAGTTQVVSVDSAGAAHVGRWPAVSDDGRFVAFATSDALVPEDTNAVDDVYLRDRQAGTTTRVSVRPDGSQFTTWTSTPTISGDGRFLAFVANGSFQAPGGVTMVGVPEVWVVDREAGTVEELTGPDGEPYGDTYAPAISRDGTAIAFLSTAANLSPLVTSGATRHVYVKRLQ